jgi:ribosomal protein S18 acetylase RimI-like enzyme
MTSSSAGRPGACHHAAGARTLAAVELRRATRADAPALADIAAAAYAPYLARMGGLRPGPMDTDYAAAVTDTEAWVALLDGAVAGFALLVEEDESLLLENVAVLPPHHGRGIGRALLEHAETRAVELGLDRVRLFTHVTMVENQALYGRIGYVETARTTEHGFTRVFYEKRL